MENLVLELNHVEKSFMSKNVLTIENLKVYENEKIGIVGGNGEGKSTLLNLIAKKMKPDIGNIHRLIEFEYYEQIKENINPDYTKIDPEHLSRLDVPSHEVAHLSGGEKTRLRLAEYFSTYNLGLLMDEPTTHLDIEGIQFLIDELKYYYGTLLVVSHNRYFLDEIVDIIWEVDNGKITVYPGNYSIYQELKQQELIEQQNAYEKFIKEKSRLEQAAKEKQARAEKLSNVSEKQKNRFVKPDRLSSSKQKDTVQKAAHRSAKAIEKRVEQLETVGKVETDHLIQFPEPENLEMHNDFPIMGQKISIQKGKKYLFDEANFQLPIGKRIAIVGPNGSGKSTLLNHIITNSEGITLSNKIVFSVYKQMAYQLTEDKTILEFLKQDSHMKEPIIRSILNNLGFEQVEIVKKIVSDLSGGEATRLAIAKLFTDPSNVLILDEPTNFIDVQTIEALEVLMKSYRGTILFTSHDKYFVENVADQIWRIESRKLKLIEY
ncbi:macrolide transport system ATP-binding/permease protein [Atopostipes suicloacalis DSM 15692]|uniref:Macrolide transport system ATP-binding/permease protein n=1 Tax=Atopostipes suicloacalis DSM 15692 TaxID=1121025 RepID=A0A1M4XZ76_9LACT|nr:ABC-F type ribosomal protection protein [Atopostipes suicloacalis]SHE98603.1 macrolide transport system ATP-binding/permease protein [Atopostipes suicloacalis DSM 15692]